MRGLLGAACLLFLGVINRPRLLLGEPDSFVVPSSSRWAVSSRRGCSVLGVSLQATADSQLETKDRSAGSEGDKPRVSDKDGSGAKPDAYAKAGGLGASTTQEPEQEEEESEESQWIKWLFGGAVVTAVGSISTLAIQGLDTEYFVLVLLTAAISVAFMLALGGLMLA